MKEGIVFDVIWLVDFGAIHSSKRSADEWHRDMQHLYRAVRYPSIHEDYTHTHTNKHLCNKCTYTEQHSGMHTPHSHKHTKRYIQKMLCARAQYEQRINENGSIRSSEVFFYVFNALSVCACAKWIPFLAYRFSTQNRYVFWGVFSFSVSVSVSEESIAVDYAKITVFFCYSSICSMFIENVFKRYAVRSEREDCKT